jgi:hypothetical protein
MFTLILFLLVIHFIADFICQSHWMATNKSTSNYALLIHVGVYSSVLLISLIAFQLSITLVLLYVVINGSLHFVTDYVTSRCSSYFYKKQDFHNFFVVIGADQLIHQWTLILTAYWLLL